MGQRLDLQAILEGILGTGNVYFQPPNGLAIEYPCIVYHQDNAVTEFADNNPYRYTKRYQVTYMDKNPVSGIPDKIAQLPMTLFNRFFPADNLNHFIFTLYF